MNAHDRHLARLEREQHGLVALHQLANDDEWTRSRVDHRVRGRRDRVARQVYANPSVRPSYQQRVLATVLSAGDGAFASHETAAKLWGLPLPRPALLEVTTPLDRRPIPPGTRMHRSGLILPEDVRSVDQIPVSSVELTIASMSSRFGVVVLGRMADDAVRRRIMTLDALAEIVERLRPAPGRSTRKMREVLARRLPGVEDRESDLEDFLLASILRFRLPMPIAQHEVLYEGQLRRIDLCYPDDWLALEAKGFRWYRLRSVWDRDALRGNELQLAHFRVLSFTSAFTDWQIATQVAEALGLPRPAWQQPHTFADWSRRR